MMLYIYNPIMTNGPQCAKARKLRAHTGPGTHPATQRLRPPAWMFWGDLTIVVQVRYNHNFTALEIAASAMIKGIGG